MCKWAEVPNDKNIQAVLMDDEVAVESILNFFDGYPSTDRPYSKAQVRTRLKDGTTQVRCRTVSKASKLATSS